MKNGMVSRQKPINSRQQKMTLISDFREVKPEPSIRQRALALMIFIVSIYGCNGRLK